MKYKRFENTIIARIDKDEEILEQLEYIADKEHISLAHVSAIGAINCFTVGTFEPDRKEYIANHFYGTYEILSLTGTITTKDDKPYLHIHMSASDEHNKTYGGHLNKAIVSATCEVMINIINGKVNRYFDEEVGLNLFDL